MTNLLMQVETEKELLQWHAWFNSYPDENAKTNASTYYKGDRPEDMTLIDPSEKMTGFCKRAKSRKSVADDNGKSSKTKRFTRQIRSDSGHTTHRLLDNDNQEYDNDDRRISEATTVGTIDSCYKCPAEMLSEYGDNEINRAREVQQQLQLQRGIGSLDHSSKMKLESNTGNRIEHTSQTPADSQASFHSSFAEYLSQSCVSANESTGSEGTTAIAASFSLSEITEESSSNNDNNSR